MLDAFLTLRFNPFPFRGSEVLPRRRKGAGRGRMRTRREQAERERDEARHRLEELQRPPEAPETSTGESEEVEGQETGEVAQEAAEPPRGGKMKATAFAFILALLGVLVALAAAVYGRFFM